MMTSEETPQLVLHTHHLTQDAIENQLTIQATGTNMLSAEETGGISNENVSRSHNLVSGMAVGSQRVGKWKHRIYLESPPIHGRRFKYTEVVHQGVIDDRMEQASNLLNQTKTKILDSWLRKTDMILRANGEPIDEDHLMALWTSIERERSTWGETALPAMVMNILPSWIVEASHNNHNHKIGYMETWIIAASLHEVWIEIKTAIEEVTDMAKGRDEMVWWVIEGDGNKVTDFAVSLQRRRHYVVQDKKSRIYLKIQNSEQNFVRSHAGSHNLTAKRIDKEPKHAEAKCGKYTTQVAKHQGQCGSCKSLIQNEARAEASATQREVEVVEQERLTAIKLESTQPTTKSPDGIYQSGIGTTHPRNPYLPPQRINEAQEWAAKNGPVISIQGPTEGIDPLDFVSIAVDYRSVAERLMERAVWFTTAADKYEALGKPSEAVEKAEQDLVDAKKQAEQERTDQVKALQSMLTDGPPA